MVGSYSKVLRALAILCHCLLLMVFLCDAYAGTSTLTPSQVKAIDQLISKMTLAEKVGQLTQYSDDAELTGPVGPQEKNETLIKKGLMGSMLNVVGAQRTKTIQKLAVEQSRLKIPILFAYDVIHGHRTIFPIPLGETSSWDMELLKKTARVAAIEASSSGLHWTFAPMIDISRDPRWGRIMEGAGEDPYLGSLIAKARIQGFQGNRLDEKDTVLACAKHFVAYGAPEGGRDYNTVDMSKRVLHETYLKPFKASVEAGVETFMTSFNEIDGVPATGRGDLIQGLLRKQWGFSGMVVSDWGSIMEMVVHGAAKNRYEASRMAIKSGVDMDMQSEGYINDLEKLVASKQVSLQLIDQSVRRVLEMKMKLGLFEDPYRYSDPAREKATLLKPEHRKIAREAAQRSMVLLKNKDKTLPLSKKVSKIALIGPLMKSQEDLIATWSAKGRGDEAISIFSGIQSKVSSETQVIYAKGSDITGDAKGAFAEAVEAAKKSDVVVVALGESAHMSGEGYSRADIGLPGVQLELLKELKKTGKPIVTVLLNGRPLVLTEVEKHTDAILEAWLPGTEGGNAVGDVLFGDYNPSGKLTISFPYAVGQIPVYYAHKNTGRPKDGNERYRSHYIDIPNKPLYPFGYGLSYTDFQYSDISLSRKEIGLSDELSISVEVKNTGDMQGEEIVQLYIRDHVGSTTRPVKELKGFKKVSLAPGKSQKVEFKIRAKDLAFYTRDMSFKAEPGKFTAFVGSNSEDLAEAAFTLVE